MDDLQRTELGGGFVRTSPGWSIGTTGFSKSLSPFFPQESHLHACFKCIFEAFAAPSFLSSHFYLEKIHF